MFCVSNITPGSPRPRAHAIRLRDQPAADTPVAEGRIHGDVPDEGDAAAGLVADVRRLLGGGGSR